MNIQEEIIQHFRIPASQYQFLPIHSGHINESYQVVSNSHFEIVFFLQKINESPFTSVKEVMQNMEHIIAAQNNNPTDFIKPLQIIKSIKNNSYHIDGQGKYWRMFQFLKGYETIKNTDNSDNIYLMGKGFGGFLRQIQHMPIDEIKTTIPKFHSLKSRLFFLQKSMKSPYKNRMKNVNVETKIIDELLPLLLEIDRLIDEKKIPLKICHNDTKSSNAMLNIQERKVAIIDLDTTMPGTILYDYGDAIRSIISTSKEDEHFFNELQWDKQNAFHEGFMKQIANSLSQLEMQLLPLSMSYMPMIMGVRFLTDYLNGDVYFSTSKEEHNLVRAKNQLSLSYEIAKSSNLI